MLQRSTWPDEPLHLTSSNAIIRDSTVGAQEVAVRDYLELASTYYFLTLSLTMSAHTRCFTMRLLSSTAQGRIAVVSGRLVHENRCHRVGAHWFEVRAHAELTYTLKRTET